MFFSIFHVSCSFFFFFNDTATTEIYTLSLHDALPICDLHYSAVHAVGGCWVRDFAVVQAADVLALGFGERDRKSTRLNSSHGYISYAVFCLKKKKKKEYITTSTRDRQPRRGPRYGEIA